MRHNVLINLFSYQFNIDRICPKCLKENKVIYDFSLVGKEDVYSTHFFRFKVNSVDGNAVIKY